MRKIPTLFLRDENDRKHVTREVNPGCEWVLAGEGVATRKYDGTCVLIRDGRMYGRREIKPGKTAPPDFEPTENDEMTGKVVGWVPVTDGPEWHLHREALGFLDLVDGTYELVGPKVNGNPEHLAGHVLISHEMAERYPAMNRPDGYDELATVMATLPWEGIVWHHPDGRMAKLKKRDFPRAGGDGDHAD